MVQGESAFRRGKIGFVTFSCVADPLPLCVFSFLVAFQGTAHAYGTQVNKLATCSSLLRSGRDRGKTDIKIGKRITGSRIMEAT